MTSSSSLYGSVTQQNVSSSNSTSLYGEAGTPIPDSSGNVVVRGDLYVLSGNILTTAATGNIFPQNATTINLGTAATSMSIGAGTGTTTINNNLTVGGTVTAPGADFGNITIAVADDNTITTTSGNLKLGAVASTGVVAIETVNASNPTSITRTTTGTNNAARSLTLISQSSGTPTVGFGNTLEYQVETAVGVNKAAGFVNVVSTDLTSGSEDFTMNFGLMQNGATYSNKMSLDSTGSLAIDNDLTIGGNTVSLAQGTEFQYSESNNRLNRPSVISTTGNTSGWRIRAPNATTSAAASMSVANTNDADNTKFMSVQATGSTTEPFRIVSGEYIAGVLNPSGDSISIRDGVTQYATINPAGPTVNSDLTTKLYVDNAVATTGVTSITGTTNQVIASSPTGAVTLSLPQSIATTSEPTFGGATLGAITVGVADNQTITTTTGELRLSSTSAAIKLPSVTSIYTDTTGSFGILNQPTTVNAFLAATALNLGATTGTTNINNDLLIDGNSVGLATGTVVSWNGNNTRANYPNFQSTSGNTSGIRVIAPNATTSAAGQVSAFATNDINNGEFLTMRASGSTTAPFVFNTGKYTGGVVGSSGKPINWVDNATTYASINPAGPTNGTDLTTKTYVDAQIGTIPAYDTNVVAVTGGVELDLREVALGYTIVGSTKFLGGTNITVSETAPNEITIDGTDLNTTYTVDATSTTGGANLNLVGSDSTTDSVAYLGSGATTVTRTDANTITISSTDNNTTYTQDVSSTTGGANLNLVGSDSTTDSVKFAGGTNVSIVATDASTMTISATDTNTTYDFNATSTTGGANLNLVGSDSTTDTVKLANGTGVTVSQTSGTEVSVAIGQDVATSADVTFNSVDANITGGNYILGQIVATPTTSYVPPGSPLTTVSGQNGIVVVSSTGNAPSVSARYFSGDTSAGVATAAAFTQGGASGTSLVPGGNAANQVMGTLNFDGYTAGTSNNWASQIATQNQGGGTIALQPLQAQGYARQAFTNSTTVTTAVTGASGTGSVATLTFATQNLPPYTVGQSVTIAGMTPSGYNGTYTITAATVSSISYANATTGFTSGGTIAAANTVTAVGMGFRVRGWQNSTNMTPASRINFMDLTATTAAFKAGTYTFSDEITTGALSTSRTYLTLNSTSAAFASAGNTYANLNSSNTLLSAGGVNYASISGSGTTFTNTGINNFVRQGTTNTTQPAALLRYSRTDTTGSNDGDGVDFRLGTGGTVTTNNIGRFDAQYRTSGFHTVGISVSTDNFSADTDTIYRGQADKTIIRVAPTGTTGTAADTLTVESTKITMAAPVAFPVYTAAAAGAITGAVGWQICISNSASGGNPNGMMAFWDTTNARWSYIHDNSAV